MNVINGLAEGLDAWENLIWVSQRSSVKNKNTVLRAVALTWDSSYWETEAGTASPRPAWGSEALSQS